MLKRKIKRLAVALARVGYPHPWRAAKRIFRGQGSLLREEGEWRVWKREYFCTLCGEYHEEIVGFVAKDKRYMIDFETGKLKTARKQ